MKRQKDYSSTIFERVDENRRILSERLEMKIQTLQVLVQMATEMVTVEHHRR